ncbi:MAG: hypothetical protein LBU65_07330 [Planctomycetaceae bacterium]|jgi:hypothetical protein|nr:hypothetical protein [Planctomycetaceae bacterium]
MKRIPFFSRRRVDAGNTVTLFPFLAVLLCTMGALIMLLVVIAQKVRNESNEQQTATAAQRDSGLNKQLTLEEANEAKRRLLEIGEDIGLMTNELTNSRDTLDAKLVDARAKLAAFEEQTRRMRDEKKRLLAAADNLENSADAAAVTQQVDELKKQQDVLTELKSQIRKQIAANAAQKEMLSIIPYTGKSGTLRRPIFIECNEKGAVLQPEGVTLTMEDMVLPERADNPVAISMRAVRQYLIESNKLEPNEEPYPLFVVRPSGVMTFYSARDSLRSWAGEYGYELVGEKDIVEMPAANAELKYRVETQLAEKRKQLAPLIHAAIMEERRANANGRGGNYGFGSGSREYRVGSNGVERADGSPSGWRPRTGARNSDTNNGIVTATGSNNAATTSRVTGSQAAGSNVLGSSNTPELPNGAGGSDVNNGMSAIEAEAMTQKSTPLTDSLFANQNQTTSTQVENGEYTLEFVPSEQKVGSNADGSTASNVQSNDNTQNAPSNSNASNNNPPKTPSLPFSVSAQGTESRGDVTVTVSNKHDFGVPDYIDPIMISVQRTIRVRCEKDNLILLAQPGMRNTKRIPIEDTMLMAVEKFEGELDAYIKTWDSAGARSYWQPVLKVQVAPDAEERFNTLKLLLPSKLIIERE